MPEGEPGRFACQFNDCSRTFSRQEHLQRHVLNHADGEFTCERCRTVFKRPDLLERHMARHRRKDAEGVPLMTRKRLWKDVDGRVVNRPAKEARTLATTTTSQVSSEDPAFYPPSPPKSASDLAISPPSADILGTLGGQDNTSQLDDFNWDHFQSSTNTDLFWDTSLQPGQTLSYSTGPFDDIFAPDTASSFNMPYTTKNNYNWLFDLDLIPPVTLESPQTQPASEMRPSIDGNSDLGPHLPSDAMMGTTSYGRSIEPAADNQRMNQLNGETFLMAQHSDQPLREKAFDQTHNSSNFGNPQEAPMMLLGSHTNLPHITGDAHTRVLDIIETSHPTTPDGSTVTVDHPLLSRGSIQGWLNLFFLRFNTVYPLIHVPTFDINETEPILVLSILLLGATYADKNAHQLAVCVHDVIRPQIFSNPGFSAKPELWVLQATLLTECLGKSRAGQKQHDMSHLFHGLLINLIRRSDCQSIVAETETDSDDDVETSWKAWAVLEQKKRLAQLCFVWDVQHAVLFSQSLCMSAFELRSTLPCDQTVWEASSATEWKKTSSQRQAPALLLTELKRCLNGHASQSTSSNLLGRVVVLHGLMSISWDMTRRDQTSLGLVSDKIAASSWKTRMKQAYDNWKGEFDKYCSGARRKHSQLSGLDHDHSSKIRTSFETYVASYKALYHAAQLVLAADILDLQIYAGARHILGRPVSKIDYVRSQKVVKAWANENKSQAASAAWHAAHILRASLDTESVSVTGDIFHQPWTLFLANLAVWTFFQASKNCAGTSLDDEMIWDIEDDMKQLLKDMTASPADHLRPSCNTSTAGLTAVVVKRLSKIRWGVIHDGMLVLRGLVQWRLINDEECRA